MLLKAIWGLGSGQWQLNLTQSFLVVDPVAQAAWKSRDLKEGMFLILELGSLEI
jgi:hypothetical protein